MTDSANITIRVPRELRAYCDGTADLRISAPNVRAALSQLERRYPAVYRGVCDETGQVRRHINVFVNSSHMRERQGMETTLEPGDVVTILPAVSGG